MSFGAGFGSLVSGFQQGADFASDIQYKRKRKKALEYGLAQMDRDEQAAQANANDITDEERAFYGDQTTMATSPEFDGDPFMYRMMDWATKKFGKKRRRAVSGIAEAPSPPTMEDAAMSAPGLESATAFPLEEEPRAYADGGRITEDELEELNRQQERNARSEIRKEKVKAAGRKALDLGEKGVSKAKSAARYEGVKPKGVGALRGAAAGGAAAAGIGGALQGLGTPTEDYYTRLGLDPRDAGLSFWKDAGVRSLGVLSDVGASALGMVGIDQRSRFADVQGGQPAPAAAQPDQAPPYDEVMGDAPSVAGAYGGRAVVSPTGAPSPSRSPQPGDAFDLSAIDIDSSELPNLNVNDWKRVRAQALRTARLKGMPQAEALDQADKIVTGIQIRGFTNYASQASALMQAGNIKGATRALRAAYQYFPDGNDVKIGVQNGHIVAVGIDEATGQPFDKGTRVVTPEFLAGAIQNFSNPTAFLSWTKDWRDEQFKRQKYAEVEKPLAEAQGQALRQNADARMIAADAATQRARLALSMGGLKPSDMRGAQQFFVQRLELMGVTDPEQADQLGSIMAQVKTRFPQVPEMQIINDVMRAAQSGTLDQVLQRLQGGGMRSPMAPQPGTPPSPRATALPTQASVPIDPTLNPNLDPREAAYLSQKYYRPPNPDDDLPAQ